MSNGVPKASGIITRVYKSGSIIYFAGDKSEKIYILKSGRVILTSIKPDTGAEIKEDVRRGEFFGVKSSLGKYPREETAQTVGETIVLVLGLVDFEKLISKNVEVVRKMLSVFSNQLRRIGKMVRSVLGDSDNLNPDAELFRIGEYYYKTGVFRQAQYAFKRYMEYYPDGNYAKTAMQRIKAIDSGEAVAGDTGFNMNTVSKKEAPKDIQMDNAPIDEGPADLDDFSFDDKESKDDSPDLAGGSGPDDFFSNESSGSKSSLTNEMDDFLSGDSSSAMDDFLTEDPKSGGNKFEKLYKQGVKNFSDENFDDAVEMFSKVIDGADQGDSLEGKLLEDSYIEKGRSYINLGKNREALETLSFFIKNYPKSANLKKALFYMGTVFEASSQDDKAQTYFKKVASMPPKDAISKEAENKLS